MFLVLVAQIIEQNVISAKALAILLACHVCVYYHDHGYLVMVMCYYNYRSIIYDNIYISLL